MKIVINKCFGGFGLSALAVKRLAELNGKKCYFYTGGLGEEYKRVSIKDCEKSMFWYAFTDDIERINKAQSTPKNWSAMSNQEKDARNKLYEAINIDKAPEDRTDSKLIQVIEELGESVAGGRFAKLKIVEIPDGIKWEIDEYDGNEDIYEVHRSWS